MVHGIVEAAKFLHEHRAESIAVAKKHFGTYSDEVLAQSIDMLTAMTPSPPLTTPQMLENGDRINIAAGFLKDSDKLSDYKRADRQSVHEVTISDRLSAISQEISHLVMPAKAGIQCCFSGFPLSRE